jgi:hypothetical protein
LRYYFIPAPTGLEIAAPLGLKIRLKCLTGSSYLLFYPSVKKEVADKQPREGRGPKHFNFLTAPLQGKA